MSSHASKILEGVHLEVKHLEILLILNLPILWSLEIYVYLRGKLALIFRSLTALTQTGAASRLTYPNLSQPFVLFHFSNMLHMMPLPGPGMERVIQTYLDVFLFPPSWDFYPLC